MLLHARAPLSPIGRRRVVDRVVVEGWSVTAAAVAAERTLVLWWRARFPREGQLGLVDRRPIPRRLPRRTPIDRVVAICELRRLRLTAAEIAERLEMPLSTVSAILSAKGWASARGSSRPSRSDPTSASGRASSSTSTSRSSAGSSAARASGSPAGPARGARRRAPTRRACGAEGRLGIRSRRRRRLLPLGLRRGARRPESRDRDRLPRARTRVLLRTRHPGRAGHDRRMYVKWPRRAGAFLRWCALGAGD